MNDCLSKEDLELLSNDEFYGKGLFKALKHLELCEKCRAQIKLPTKEEILKRFEEDETPLPSSPNANTSSPSSASSITQKK